MQQRVNKESIVQVAETFYCLSLVDGTSTINGDMSQTQLLVQASGLHDLAKAASFTKAGGSKVRSPVPTHTAKEDGASVAATDSWLPCLAGSRTLGCPRAACHRPPERVTVAPAESGQVAVHWSVFRFWRLPPHCNLAPFTLAGAGGLQVTAGTGSTCR